MNLEDASKAFLHFVIIHFVFVFSVPLPIFFNCMHLICFIDRDKVKTEQHGHPVSGRPSITSDHSTSPVVFQMI
jgi:hypothetical protein